MQGATDARLIEIEDRRSLAVVADPIRGGVFELIRRSRSGTTFDVLAAASGLPMSRLTEAVDALESIGLVRMVRARGGKARRVQAAFQSIAIVADPSRDDHVQAVRRHFASATEDIDAALKQASRFDKSLPKELYRLDARLKFRLRAEEWREFRRLARSLIAFLEGVAKSRSHLTQEELQLCDHVLSIQVCPADPPLLPSPIIRVVGPGQVVALGAGKASAFEGELSEREREVAMLVAARMKRAEVARKLGVSPNTVSTFLKRAYAKLGVHSAAGLRQLLLMAPTPGDSRRQP